MAERDSRGIALERVGRCDLCGSSDSELWEVYRRYGFQWDLVECSSCGLGYVDPRPTVDSMSWFYDAEYTTIHGEYAEPGWMEPITRVLRSLLAARYSASPSRRALARAVFPWERKWREILAANHLETITSVGSILDVGCGHGAWLNTMRRWGFECFGCEPDPLGAEAAKASGLAVVQCDLPGAEYPPATFDVVRFSHVLEHVHSPTDVLTEAVRVTKPGGIVVVIVPNHGGLIGQSFRLAEDVPRHLFAFDPSTLERYMEKVGLEVVLLKTYTEFAHSVYSHFVPPVVGRLAARGASDTQRAEVESFFSFRSRERTREYEATAAFADSLDLGAMVAAVGRREPL